MKGERRKARGIALQALYEIDIAGHRPDEVVERLLAESALSEENEAFARALVRGVVEHGKDIDRYIRELAPAWPLEQLSLIDRNILRLALFEILFDNGLPVGIAINEAVEMAKHFGGDHSPRFINGVLGSAVALTGRK